MKSSQAHQHLSAHNKANRPETPEKVASKGLSYLVSPLRGNSQKNGLALKTI